MKIDPEFDYAEAHSPDSWRILGVRLLPFRAGHKLILQRTGSPFLFDTVGDIEIEHLIFALWVCSRPYKKAQHYRLRLLSLEWMLFTAIVSLRCAINEEIFLSRVELFFNYMNEANVRPSSMRRIKRDGDADEDRNTFAPSLMILKRDLLGQNICDQKTVSAFWEMPLRLAYYERYAQLEREGSVTWPQAWELKGNQ